MLVRCRLLFSYDAELLVARLCGTVGPGCVQALRSGWRSSSSEADGRGQTRVLWRGPAVEGGCLLAACELAGTSSRPQAERYYEVGMFPTCLRVTDPVSVTRTVSRGVSRVTVVLRLWTRTPASDVTVRVRCQCDLMIITDDPIGQASNLMTLMHTDPSYLAQMNEQLRMSTPPALRSQPPLRQLVPVLAAAARHAVQAPVPDRAFS
eukprot:2982561-Rhodomonas_salina.3